MSYYNPYQLPDYNFDIKIPGYTTSEPTQERTGIYLPYNPFKDNAITPVINLPPAYTPLADGRKKKEQELLALVPNSSSYAAKIADPTRVDDMELDFLIALFREPQKFYPGYSSNLYAYEVLDQICQGVPIDMARANARSLIENSLYTNEGKPKETKGTPATNANGDNLVTQTASKYGWVAVIVAVFLISKL